MTLSQLLEGDSGLQHGLFVILILPVLYTFTVVLYRIYFHPLSKYPGPFLAKLTDCYLAYYAWRGDRHLEFYRAHKKYGQFVRLGPNLLSVNSASALKTIYGFKSNVRKSDFYLAFPAKKGSESVHSTIDKQVHARKRRVLSHAFSESAIKSMERYVVANVDDACQVLRQVSAVQHIVNIEKDEKGWLPAVDMGKWADYLTFDIMGDLAFGKSFGMTASHPENRFVTDLIGAAAHRHLICGTYLTIHDWHLDKWLFPHIAAGRAKYMQYSKTQVLERTKMGDDTDRKDFFYYLLHAQDPETGMGFCRDELWGESNLLIIAGSDTTSTALASTIFYLVHNQRALTRVTSEVRGTFASVDDIVHGSKLSGCHYLRACLDEAMRLSPPVGGGLPRTILSGGMTIDGQDLPEGIDVCVPHYALHHNGHYFSRPFDYLPERWVHLEAEAVGQNIEVGHAAFCPFSIGPRGCIGKGLAYSELTTALARTVYQFDLRLGCDQHDAETSTAGFGYKKGEYQLRDSFTSMKSGPWVQARPVS